MLLIVFFEVSIAKRMGYPLGSAGEEAWNCALTWRLKTVIGCVTLTRENGEIRLPATSCSKGPEHAAAGAKI